MLTLPCCLASQELRERLAKIVAALPDRELLWVNPVGQLMISDANGLSARVLSISTPGVALWQDCGLKTRGWKETEASLLAMVATARWARKEFAAPA